MCGTFERASVLNQSCFPLFSHVIRAYASKLGEKVLVFSQCLRTLDYIEQVLALDDWKSRVPSLSCFKGMQLGRWKKSRDYLRIDGDTHSSERGDLIDTFNRDDATGKVRAFLISSMAGGIGINLVRDVHFVLVRDGLN
jgi:SNF2 family DNA or RNA helicase